MVMRRFSLVLVLASLAATSLVSACRNPEDLIAQVNTTVFVFGVDEDQEAQLDIAGQRRRGAAEQDDLVMLQLALPPGEHDGQMTILKQEDDGLEPVRCGPIHVSLPDAASRDNVAIQVEDLRECEGDDDDGDEEEEEGEEDSGEGEGDGEGEGEGEGEEDEEEEDPPEGEGEQQDPQDPV